MDNIPNKNITIEQLDEMFNSIAEQGQWDLSKPLLWGYFFTDNDPDKLELVMPKIQAMGYKVVGIFQAEKEDENEPDLFYLHIENPEIHNSESLDKRNDEFYIFAHQNGLDSYDGMDVGPIAQ
ncbi:ribonuclease E inhibitor RraB [Shewanella sp. MMG014]|nr:ribonuclease E inhibitor RraB [Shewanella sp. MMG014]MBQ4892341.1 ribonuclease E inhibitor RraB [Shewanella sp. MMG014]